MRLAETLARAASYLEERGVESPRLDAELLLGKALGLERIELYTQHDRPLTESELTAARELVRRRGRREPLAYVLGEWGFRRLTLRTDRRALVPRPETEVVVERCLALLRDLPEPDVLDVGTGTGAIALAVADEHPGARVTAVDRSRDALALARENLDLTGIDGRVRLVEGDVREGLERAAYDLVVSNPPYVSEEEVASLPGEVRDWEPRDALVGAGTTEAVARAAVEALRPGGWLVLEVHEQGAGETAELLERLGYRDVGIACDLAGKERVVEATR